jgi:hypothetical protein
MTCAALAAATGAVIVSAHMSAPGAMSGDHIVGAPSPDGYAAEVCYFNHENRSSIGGDYEVEIDGVRIAIHVKVGHENEIVTFTVPNGYTVFPADHGEVSVPDGESVTVYVAQALF